MLKVQETLGNFCIREICTYPESRITHFNIVKAIDQVIREMSVCVYIQLQRMTHVTQFELFKSLFE